MRTVTTSILAMASVCSLFGCNGSSDPEFKDSIPESEGLMIDFPSSSSSARARLPLTEDVEESARCYESSLSLATRANEIVANVLDGLDRITDFPSTQVEEDVYQWGPWEDEGVSKQLLVTVEDDGSYSYRFQGAEAGATEYLDLITGVIDAGGTKTVGSGSFLVDLDSYQALGLRDEVGGTMDFTYAQDSEEARSIDVALTDYLFDNGEREDAQLLFDRAADKSGQLDWYRNRSDFYDADTTDTENLVESLKYRARWTADRAGRCDGEATGGDLGARVVTAHQCWDTSTAATYYQSEIDGEVNKSEGEATTCVFTDVSYPE